MACDRMRELAFLSVDGELTEGERGELAAHLATCAECRAAQAAAARVASGVRQLAPPPVPLGFAERTVKRVESGGAPVRRPRPLPRMVPIAAVAATLVAVALFVVEQRRPRAPDGTEIASQPPQAPGQSAPESRRHAVEADDGGGGAVAGKLAKQADGSKEADGDALRDLSGKERGASEERERANPGAEAKWKSGELVALLAAGSPAEALRRITASVDVAELKNGLAEKLEQGFAKRIDAEKDDEGADQSDAERRDDAGDKAPAEKQEAARGRAGDGARPPAPSPPAPTLRFLRVHGDAGAARKLDESLAGRDVRDGAGRFVVDLDEAEAKSLRAQFDAKKLEWEEVTPAAWLAAAEAAANERRLAAAALTAAPASAQKSAPVSRGELPRKDGALKKAEETRKDARDAPTGGGDAGRAIPQRKRERWLLLFTSG